MELEIMLSETSQNSSAMKTEGNSVWRGTPEEEHREEGGQNRDR